LKCAVVQGEGRERGLSGSVVNQVGISMLLKLFVMELSKFHNFLTGPCGRDRCAAAFGLLNVQGSEVWISVFTMGSLSPS